LYYRYNDNLKFAKVFGIRKAMINGGGMGFTYFILFATYALAFWYGGTLTVPKIDDKGVYHAEYTIGQLLIVRSLLMNYLINSLNDI